MIKPVKERSGAPPKRAQRVSIVRVLVGVFVVLGSIAFLITAISSLQFNRNLSKVKTTVSRMVEISDILEQARNHSGDYPAATSIQDISTMVDESKTLSDGWGNSLFLESTGDHYVLVSFGSDGMPQYEDPWSYPEGTAVGFSEDIVIVDSAFRVRHEAMEWGGR